MACEGMCLADPDSAKGLHRYAHHFKVFIGLDGKLARTEKMIMCTNQEVQDTYIVRYGDCKKTWLHCKNLSKPQEISATTTLKSI